MSDRRAEVYRQFQAGQERRVYFLLAAAAAGIAFAVQQTQSAVLTWQEWPLGVAVLSWAFSFFAGCRNRDYALSFQYKNLELLRLEEHGRPAAIELAKKIGKSGRMVFWSNAQSRALVTGAVFFIVWHVLGMALRTNEIEGREREPANAIQSHHRRPEPPWPS